MNLKQLPAQERPRERLARYGVLGLSTVELLAILLGSGTKNRSVIELAADLLSHFGSLDRLAEASLEELQEVKGIGKTKALLLHASFGLIERFKAKEAPMVLDTPEKVYQSIRPELPFQKVEVLWLFLRDVRKGCIHREVISKGTLTELLMHPREIFHLAIRHRAHSLIIAHNHPSGDPTPSTRDLEMTDLLAAAGRVVGIEVSDHLIVGERKFVSLFQEGWIGAKRRSY